MNNRNVSHKVLNGNKTGKYIKTNKFKVYTTQVRWQQYVFRSLFIRLQWYCPHKPLRKGVSKPSKDLRAQGDILAWKQDVGRSHTPASTQFSVCQNMWEYLVPPFNIYCGGTSIIRWGPSGHSVTHPPGKWHSGFKWDKTFASGISISKPNMHTGAVWQCYVILPPRHLRQEVRLKRDSERDCALQTGGNFSFLHFCLCLPSTPTSTRHPAPSPNTHTQMADVLLHHRQTRPRLLTSVNLVSPLLHHIAQSPWHVSLC